MFHFFSGLALTTHLINPPDNYRVNHSAITDFLTNISALQTFLSFAVPSNFTTDYKTNKAAVKVYTNLVWGLY